MSKKTILGASALAVAGVLAVGLSGCASCDRMAKSWDSNMSNGLDRTVVLYDYEGDELARWEGKIDLQISNDGGHIVFDQDGKRTVITGGIVVSEER